MSQPSSEERIRELARGLTPVRPIPPLFAVIALALAFALVAVAAEWLAGGVGLRVRDDAPWREPSYLTLLGGIVALAFGGLGAALARAVPGREPVARLAGGVALAGLALAIGALALADPVPAPPLDAALRCCLRALVLGLGSSAVAFVFLARAVPRGFALSAGLALAGGAAVGAIVVHLTCPSSSVVHQLCGHVLAPLAVAAALAAPGAWLLRRLRSGAR